MNRTEIVSIVQAILVEDFKVATTPIMNNKTLETLSENFKVLGALLELERLLQQRLKKEILIIEHISTSIHTPEDLVELILVHFK